MYRSSILAGASVTGTDDGVLDSGELGKLLGTGDFVGASVIILLGLSEGSGERVLDGWELGKLLSALSGFCEGSDDGVLDDWKLGTLLGPGRFKVAEGAEVVVGEVEGWAPGFDEGPAPTGVEG
jgi:hypothetical protein